MEGVLAARKAPVLALVAAVVLIDVLCDEPITAVLRRNRVESMLGVAWLAAHVMGGAR